MFAVRIRSIKSVRVESFADDWSQLRNRLINHVERADKYEGDLYSPVVYADGANRGNAGVRFINALVIDLDGESLDRALPNLIGLEWIAYTTYSHSADDPHWHLVLPLSTPVAVDDWHGVWLDAHDRLKLSGDPQTKDPARIFFLPQCAPNAEREVLFGSGDWFVPRAAHVPIRKRSSVESESVAFIPESFWDQPTNMSWCAGMTKQEAFKVARERLKMLRM